MLVDFAAFLVTSGVLAAAELPLEKEVVIGGAW